MTMRLDIVTNDAGELVRLEHARDLGSATLQAVYRLVKLAQLHDLNNQAFLRQLEQTHQAIVEYGLRAGAHFNVLFASRAVFVGGQLLKGSRAAYDMAAELAEILEWCGGSDLTIQKDVAARELHLFAEAVSVAMRGAKGASYSSPSPKIHLRAVTDAARFRGLEVEALSFEQRVVRTYASAVVILRRFFADLQASRYVLPRRIKRVAQSLVDLSDGSTPAFLGVTDVRNQNFDDAGRAVNTAILAVSMAREMTDDRVLLAQIAMAAMMHDVGRPRAAALADTGPRMPGVVARLSEDAEDKLAAGTAAVLTALGRVNEPTITRTVVAFEALWLRRERFLGPLYAGTRPATIHARILQIARRYNDLVTPEPGLPEPQPDFAIATISQELPDDIYRTVLRLLVATLRLLPVGSVVHLTSNEIAEIVPAPVSDDGSPSKSTWVRVLRDARGRALASPLDVDLSAPPRAGEPARRIASVLSTDGWGKGLELVAEEDGPQLEPLPPEEPEPEIEVERASAAPPAIPMAAGRRKPPGPPPPQDGNPQSRPSSSVPSIASIACDPEPLRASERAAASPRPDSSQAVSRSSPSDVLAPAPRLVEETRPRSVAVLEDPMIDVVTQVERLEPTARGTLTSTPIVHVLVYMLDHRQSGSVVLREADGRHHVVYFESGCPALVRNGRPLALLGDGMVAAGFLSPHVLSKALEVARRDGTLLGKYLVTSGLVTDEALRLALGAQIPRKLERMVNLPADTDYAFYSGVNLIPDWAGGEVFPCHPLTAILSAVRHWHDRARMRATLSRIMRQPLTFHPEVDLSSFILTGEEQAVIEAIQAESPTLSVLYDMRVAGEDAVSALVYTLAVTRGFAFTAGKGPPMVALPVLEEVPEALLEDDPGVAAGQGQLAERAPAHPVAWAEPSGSASSEPASAVPSAQSLVPPGSGGARPSESEGRPRQGGWRPDRVPLSKVVDPMGSAPRSLRSELGASPISGIGGAPSPHAAQSRRGPSGAGTGAPVDQAVLVQAMTDFRLAETALDRGQNVQAGELAKKALAAEPTNLEYAALVAWTNALGVQKDALPLAIAKLNVILQEDARCVRALLYRGRLYKRIKRSTEALRDFSAVLETDPRNAEAAMEVRLLRMKKK